MKKANVISITAKKEDKLKTEQYDLKPVVVMIGDKLVNITTNGYGVRVECFDQKTEKHYMFDF